jgi:pimeloyl-ACP methyl ester carboxylesterase
MRTAARAGVPGGFRGARSPGRLPPSIAIGTRPLGGRRGRNHADGEGEPMSITSRSLSAALALALLAGATARVATAQDGRLLDATPVTFDNVARRPEMERDVFAELVPGFAKDGEAALAARSVVRWADRLSKTTPILLLHGTADWRVPPGESMALAERLLENRHPFRLVMLEGGDHGLTEHRAEVDRLAREWFDRYVRDRRPWPSLEPHGP